MTKIQRGGELIDYITSRQLDGGKLFSIAIMVLILVIIVLVVLYIIYLIKTSSFSSTMIVKGTISVSDTANSTIAVQLPSSSSATSTYTFWVYLTSFVPQGVTNEPGLVWLGFTSNSTSSSGTTTTTVTPGSIQNISPIVSIDASTNRMYASFYLSSGGVGSGPSTNLMLSQLKPARTNLNGDMRNDPTATAMPFVTIPIDYVPLQRWVQYTFVISSSAVSIYQDASVYSVRSASDLESPTGSTTRPLFGTGNPTWIMTTANTDATRGPIVLNPVQQQNMYLASLAYYNYGLNQSDIQALYSKGPQTTTSWFSWMNIGGYRLQWPVTQVDTTSSTSVADNRNQM